MFNRLYLSLWQGGLQCSLQLLIQPWICAPGTHYGWVDWGIVEYKVCPTLLHMANTGNWTTDLLILSPTPYTLCHMLPPCLFCAFPRYRLDTGTSFVDNYIVWMKACKWVGTLASLSVYNIFGCTKLAVCKQQQCNGCVSPKYGWLVP